MQSRFNFTKFAHEPRGLTRRHILGGAIGWMGMTALNPASGATPVLKTEWAQIVRKAKGQQVYFNAWGGSDRINAYIDWASQELKREFEIKLIHVKVSDIAQTVARITQELKRGKGQGGSVDLLWLNGENFARLKREGALMGPFTHHLPNTSLIDTEGKPTTLIDFGEPTDGLEAPWGMAQLSFFADRLRLETPPQTVQDWLALAKGRPGQLTYPQPPDFHGTTWLKQWLMSLTPDRQTLYKPWNTQAFDTATAPLWSYLDALHPHLWRNGRQFAANAAAMRQGVADQSMLIGVTFNPNEAASEIAAGRLPSTVQTFQLRGGTIGNTHFLAIPLNSSSTAAAQVVVNFLLSPSAQARKADIQVWGDPTVLNLSALNPADRAAFAPLTAPGALRDPQPTLLEPHASWVQPLEDAWRARYAR